MRYNPPPGWPTPPAGWTPPPGWKPDSAWGDAPAGWELWISDDPATSSAAIEPSTASPEAAQQTPLQPADQSDVASLLERIRNLEAQIASTSEHAHGSLVDLDDQRVLQDVGIYRYHHPLEDAPAYKERLRLIEAEMDALIKTGSSILASDMFTFSGSLAKGRKMVNDLSKLMLRTYNAEADNCVRALRSGNITTAKKRLESSVAAIGKLGSMMEMRINPEYHALRIHELELTADYQMKLQEEKEHAREERELLREQRRAEQELAAERERLDKERSHYSTALAALRAKGDLTAVAELEGRLTEIDEAIAANDYRIANIRAGYVYVISNIGAFGPGVVKIGMTRRLEPLDRVRELGDASVPFPYDVHALFFSDDAITLENDLHKAFEGQRVNFVNQRREFFFATPSEVRESLARATGGLLEFTEAPTASEYTQSRGRWPVGVRKET